jgi:hypothetical protein
MSKVKATTPAQGPSSNGPNRTGESDDETSTALSKSMPKSKVKKVDSVNLLGEFEERVHWAEQLEVWRMKEPIWGADDGKEGISWWCK